VTEAETNALLDAVIDVASGMSLKSTLQRIANNAASLTDAQYAAIGVRGRDGELEEFVYAGLTDEEADEIERFPEGRGLLGHLLAHPEVLRLDDLSTHPTSVGFPHGHPAMRTFLGAPIKVRGEKFGQIYLTEKRGGKAFTEEDERLTRSLATAAGVAIDNARSHELRGSLALIGDRERIARDLHDLVIQRLFATGMSLQGLIRKEKLQGEVAERLNQTIEELDKTIKQIRQTIFALQDSDVHGGFRRRVIAEYEAVRGLLDYQPELVFEGAVDTSVPERVAGHALAVIRELLSNVAKHAHANWAQVVVAVKDDSLSITVTDNGIGFTEPSHRRGLANVARRADTHSGLFTIEPNKPKGTKARWQIYLPNEED
jgi:signal transduction histidine kinase